jgi:protein gp37
MADNTPIEWADASWTPIRARYWETQNEGRGEERIGWHCTHVSEGCRNCYAERINIRLGTGRDYAPGELYREERKGFRNGEVKLFLDEKMLTQPLRWRQSRKIFVCSMTDLFADFVPDEWIDRVFAVMALAPQHTFMVLTKRAERMQYHLTHSGHENIYALACQQDETLAHRWHWPLPNVWLGVSAEDQARADERIPLLLDTPAAVRFISAEPLLGPIDLTALGHDGSGVIDAMRGEDWIHYSGDIRRVVQRRNKLDLVIAGAESGPNARACSEEWIRKLKDQCVAADICFFYKQAVVNGRKIPTPELDGRKWVDLPI